MLESFQIVGAKYRPPAKALLDTLATGTPLLARREASNAHDANAIQVLVCRGAFEASNALRIQCENYGKSLEEVLAAPEWHLGYVPRERASELAPRMDGAGEGELIGALTFSAQGVPCISLDVPGASVSHG